MANEKIETVVQVTRQPVETLVESGSKAGEKVLELGLAWDGGRSDEVTSWDVGQAIKDLKVGDWYFVELTPRGKYATLNKVIRPADAPSSNGSAPSAPAAPLADRPRQADHPETRRSIQAQKAVELTIDSYSIEFLANDQVPDLPVNFADRAEYLYELIDTLGTDRKPKATTPKTKLDEEVAEIINAPPPVPAKFASFDEEALMVWIGKQKTKLDAETVHTVLEYDNPIENKVDLQAAIQTAIHTRLAGEANAYGRIAQRLESAMLMTQSGRQD